MRFDESRLTKNLAVVINAVPPNEAREQATLA